MSPPNFTENLQGCWAYKIPETGVRIPAGGTTSLDNVLRLAQQYYRANGYVIPSGLRQKVIDECCSHQPPGTCIEDLRMPTPPGLTLTTAFDAVVQGSRTLATWLTQGRVSATVAERRAVVCTSCIHNKEMVTQGCKSCGLSSRLNQFSTFLARSLGADAAPWDKTLRSCEVCHCNLSLKVRTHLDPILKYSPREQLDRFPAHCWVKTETP